MRVTPDILLRQLPPYRDEWITIKDEQEVPDIIEEILDAHEEFWPYYDKIAIFFDGKTIDQICENINTYCKEFIKYKEESDKRQTTAIPTGIIKRGKGDCKHYASFCGGILDGLNRRGHDIDWTYRFVSYRIDREMPYHVFVVVFDGIDEVWFDPTPGARQAEPVYTIDAQPKFESMALLRNIGGTNTNGLYYDSALGTLAIGKASLTLTPKVNGDNNLNWEGTNNKYAGVFNPYLGLSMYRDLGGDRDLNKQQIADQLNQMIASGPDPGHTVTPDFVEWVYNSNIRSWNFYYRGGVRPGFEASKLLPATWPRVIITPDGRLTLSTDQALDDYRNAEIHLLTAWVQDLVNQHDPTPYPVKPEHIKIHSQMKEGNLETRNLFTEARGDSVFKEVAKALEDTVNFVKAGVFKIVGSIPRNAFLALVGLNFKGFATSLYNKIEAGQWDKIAETWKKLGGNPDKLRNTIEDGRKKKAILGSVPMNVIGVEPVSTTAGFLVAAAPIIAALLKFLDKDGKITEVLSATKGFLESKYPNIDLSAFGFLDRATGKEIEWIVDDVDNENRGGGNNDLPGKPNNTFMDFIKSNPLPVAGVVSVGTYFLMNRGRSKKNFLVPAIVGFATYFALKGFPGSGGSNSSGTLTTEQKAAAIIDFMNSGGDSPESKYQFRRMVEDDFTPQEVSDVYEYFFSYVAKDKVLPDGSLKDRLNAIGEKYNLFT